MSIHQDKHVNHCYKNHGIYWLGSKYVSLHLGQSIPSRGTTGIEGLAAGMCLWDAWDMVQRMELSKWGVVHTNDVGEVPWGETVQAVVRTGYGKPDEWQLIVYSQDSLQIFWPEIWSSSTMECCPPKWPVEGPAKSMTYVISILECFCQCSHYGQRTSVFFY